jgi:hypothetical protein
MRSTACPVRALPSTLRVAVHRPIAASIFVDVCHPAGGVVSGAEFRPKSSTLNDFISRSKMLSPLPAINT